MDDNQSRDDLFEKLAGRSRRHFFDNGIRTLSDLRNAIKDSGIHIYSDSVVFVNPWHHIRQCGKKTWKELLEALMSDGFDWRDYHVGETSGLRKWEYQPKTVKANTTKHDKKGSNMWEHVAQNSDITAYSLQKLTDKNLGMAALRELFANEPNRLNFVLFSTSGVHGTYTTIEDIETEILIGEEPSELTFVIIQPRMVTMRYGNCAPKTVEDIAFLKMLREKSRESVSKIG
jgi:hypothetical protein